MQMMIDVLAQILGTLWAHKLRSFLTMFGCMGVGSLLLLVDSAKVSEPETSAAFRS